MLFIPRIILAIIEKNDYNYAFVYGGRSSAVEPSVVVRVVAGSNPVGRPIRNHAGVVELVDAPDLGSGVERRGGSSPSTRTI